ncbi:putative amino acid racemase [Hydrogenispora ethanolica]|uniref:Putative amino acid racemase n=1 Tax=Hydrogenispora ethanolica TaxID=1082276 RepID=A0A4R1RSC2_HYDET|nr:alanine racemase [Hydrogenispora ethanolica]TCL69371.1 putative amino acid racemase [Hydrogenispora ethanolica]
MKTPRILIHLDRLVANFECLRRRAGAAGMELTVVLKGVAGDLRIARSLIEAGAREIGDSRSENLHRFQQLFPATRRVLLRLPSLGRLAEIAAVADLSLNTEVKTLASLHSVVQRHEVMLMIDLGDLREGVDEAGLTQLARCCRRLPNLRVTAAGTNFSCFAGAVPTVEKLAHLAGLAEQLRNEFGFPVTWVSGGNSSSLPLLYRKELPPGINHLRIGEGILLGRETMAGTLLPDLRGDAFVVEAEVIQAQRKPARTEGETGLDAFGRRPVFPEAEPGWRALLNIGHQDSPLNGLTPLDPGFTLLGGSSDYAVLACEKKPRLGQRVRFSPNYWSLLSLMTSPYVYKEYVED